MRLNNEEVLQWIKRDEVQVVVDEWAYSHNSGNDTPLSTTKERYKGLVRLANTYINWFNESGFIESSKGFSSESTHYYFNVIIMDGEPIYMDIKDRYVQYRINLYREEGVYTVEVSQAIKESRYNKLLNFGWSWA